MRKTLFTLALASASMLAVAACSSSGWGQRGSQQSGSTHTLTGGAEAAPTSESTPKPAGGSAGETSGGMSGGAGGTSGTGGTGGTGATGGTGGGGTNEGGGSMGTQPAQPVQPTENMGSSAGPTGTESGGKNPQPGQ